MRRGAAIGILATALAVVTGAGASGHAMPKHYAFSFRVASKPNYVITFPKVKVTGSGSGSFSLGRRQVTPTGVPYWIVTGPRGSFSLSTGGRVFVSAKVTGGHFAAVNRGGLERDVALTLRITSSTRFRCSKPVASLTLQDSPGTFAESMDLRACDNEVHWTARPPALVVKVRPS